MKGWSLWQNNHFLNFLTNPYSLFFSFSNACCQFFFLRVLPKKKSNVKSASKKICLSHIQINTFAYQNKCKTFCIYICNLTYLNFLEERHILYTYTSDLKQQKLGFRKVQILINWFAFHIFRFIWVLQIIDEICVLDLVLEKKTLSP